MPYLINYLNSSWNRLCNFLKIIVLSVIWHRKQFLIKHLSQMITCIYLTYIWMLSIKKIDFFTNQGFFFHFMKLLLSLITAVHLIFLYSENSLKFTFLILLLLYLQPWVGVLYCAILYYVDQQWTVSKGNVLSNILQTHGFSQLGTGFSKSQLLFKESWHSSRQQQQI